MATKFYKCNHCGNVIVKVVDAGVPVVCCGEKMVELLDRLESKTNKRNSTKPQNIVSSLKQKLSNITKDDTQNIYPKDFQWVCANCGHTKSEWNSICEKCGEIGRNYWHLYIDKNSAIIEED